MTKIQFYPESAKRTDGIFTQNGSIIAMKGHQTIEFTHLDSASQREYLNEFLRDRKAQQTLQRDFGLVGFESAYKQYLFCKCGECNRSNCPTLNKICNEGNKQN